jgi:hypothetical protein
VNKLLGKYKIKTTPTPWMEDQVKILNKYITTCMLAAEATIHSHHQEDPKKVEAANIESFGN